jgi:type VI secretion system secreted protein VgrG
MSTRTLSTDRSLTSRLRRLCEEEGLYFRTVADSKRDRVVLEDTSAKAPEPLATPLAIEDREGTVEPHLRAFDVREVRQRRAGKMTLRAYDPMKPTLPLEGVATAGTKLEKGVEIYRGAAPFLTEKEGKELATSRLQAERATATSVSFETNAIELFAGAKCTLEPALTYAGVARP